MLNKTSADISIETMSDNDESPELYGFIETSSNGTIFHHPRFLSYHSEDKFQPPEYSVAHVVLRRKGAIAGFVPGAIRIDGRKREYLSPYGASFGGLVTGDVGFQKCEDMISAVMRYLLEEMGVNRMAIAPVTSAYMGDSANDYMEFLYLSKGFVIDKSELTIVTRICPNDGFPSNVFKDRVKSSVGQSKRKGIRCSVGDDVVTAYSIIESDQKKFGKKPTHTLKELEDISKLFPGRLLNFIAYHEENAVAVVSVILCNKSTAYTFYIDQDEKYAGLRPLDLLLCEALDWLKRGGYLYLDYGPSTFGHEPHRSLIFFKEGFGGKGIIKHFYRYETN